MIAAQDFKQGQFTYTPANGAQVIVPIDFNPASLDYSVSIKARGEGGQTQQAAGAASATLNMELLFDTTDSGDDVRSKTVKVERMLRPQRPAAGPKGPPAAPPLVTFEWGEFTFRGVVESFRQTMDFFSANGVPLRAVVNLTMSQPDYQFDAPDGAGSSAEVDETFESPAGSAFQLAIDAGDASGARGIAISNGLESLRADTGAAIAVGGGITIGAAAGFSAGAGAGGGFGVSLGGGAGAGASASAGASVNFGAGASAGVSAGAGAFNGLQAGAATAGGTLLTPQRLLAASSAPGIAPGALFDVTGKAIAQNASTFKAEVGTTPRLRFDES